MKILFPADGSKYTKKALAFLVTHEGLTAEGGEVVVVNVQAEMPPRVKAMVGANNVAEYHQEESAKVLQPIERFLSRKKIPFRTIAAVGSPAREIVRLTKRERADMVIMGTHGHSLLGRALMGSVAQNVVTGVEVPVLLVK